jgi:hypothetical protein
MFAKLGSPGYKKLYILHDRPLSLISIMESDSLRNGDCWSKT